LILHPEADTDGEDVAIVADIYRRFALNLRNQLLFCRLTSTPAADVAHETADH
jgi:hypothetical protein